MAAKFVVIVAFLALVQAGVVRRDAPAPAGLSLQDAEKLNTERQKQLNKIIANFQMAAKYYNPRAIKNAAAIEQSNKDFEAHYHIPDNIPTIRLDKIFTS